MKLEDRYLFKWFLNCCKIFDVSLKFLAMLRGGARGGQDLFQGGSFPPCPPPP